MSWLFGSSAPKEIIYDELPSPQTPEDYKKVVADAKEKVMSLFNSDGPQWSEVDTSVFPADHGVTIHSTTDTSTGSAVECVRASKVFKLPPKTVFELVSNHDLATRRTWDPEVLDFKFLRELQDAIGVVYALHNAPFPVSKRDFVLATTHFGPQADGKYLAYSTSINYPGIQQDSSIVRGVIFVSAWIVEPVAGDANSCKVTRIIHVDVKGMIPTFIINANKANPGKVLLAVEKVLLEKK